MNLPLPRPDLSLRPYQITASERVRKHFVRNARGRCSQGAMIVMATGAGKTLTAMNMVAQALDKGKRVLWLAHRTELVKQPVATLRRWWPDLAGQAGIVQQRQSQDDKALVVASVATLAQPGRLESYLQHGLPAFVVTDEAHHSTAPIWLAVREQLDQAAQEQGATVFHLGLTATPEGLGLADLWEIVFSIDIRACQAQGFLLPERVELDRLPEATEQDYASDEEEGEALLRAGVVEHTVRAMARIRARGQDRRALVFTATVQQAEETAAALQEAGWAAAALSGGTAKGKRRAILRQYMEGKLDCICNAAVLTEGTDLPPCNLVVMARSCRSAILWCQTVGRGLRLFCPGWRAEWGMMSRHDPRYVEAGGQRDCIVLDLAGASLEHDLVMAPVLIGSEVHQAAERNPDGEAAEDGVLREGASQLAGLRAERKPIRATWLELDDLDRLVFFCTLGAEGGVYVVRQDDGGWRSCHAAQRARSKVTWLTEHSTSLQGAQAMGNDLVRRAGVLNAPHAPWRKTPASDAQRDLARSLGVELPVKCSKGYATTVIDRLKARKQCLTLGLARSFRLFDRVGAA